MSKPQNLNDLNNLIKQHAPIFYLNPREQYKLATVEYFLENANLIKVEDNSTVKSHPLTADDLPTASDDREKYQLALKDDTPSTRAGNPGQAKVYVNAKGVDDSHIDLQFWFFYAYNGPGTIFMGAEITRPDVKLKFWKSGMKTEKANGSALADPMGEHEGDWEHITLRIDTGSNAVTKVYFSQHSGGVWKDWSELSDKEDGRLVVYSSLNGHASYPQGNSDNMSEYHKWGALGQYLEFGLVNATDKGDRFDLSNIFELVAVDWNLNEGEVTEPKWLNFLGRWGASKTSTLSDDAIERIGKMILGGIAGAALSLPGVGSGIKSAIQHFAKMDEDGPTAPKLKGSWSGAE